MIKVTYSKDRDKRECFLRVNGHAGQAEIGKDIVCASASILTYTVAKEIKDMELRGQLAQTPRIELESGDAVIECKAASADAYEEILHTFYVVCIGYRLLAQNYPQYVEYLADYHRWKGE